MKNLMTWILMIFIVKSSFSQIIDLEVLATNDPRNSYIESRIQNEIYSKFKNDFKFVYKATNQLKISADLSKVLKLEGMSNTFVGPIKFIFNYKDGISNKDTTWTYRLDVKVSSQNEIAEKAINTFNSDPKGLSQIEKNIYLFSSKKKSEDCKSVLEKANVELIKKKYKEAFHLAESISNSKCSKEGNSLLKNIEDEYSKEFCEEKLTRIQVLANSGIEYKMELAIEEILKMPKMAKCKEEAVKISKQIGEYLAKKPNSEKRIMEINTIVVDGRSINSIFKD